MGPYTTVVATTTASRQALRDVHVEKCLRVACRAPEVGVGLRFLSGRGLLGNGVIRLQRAAVGPGYWGTDSVVQRPPQGSGDVCAK